MPRWKIVGTAVAAMTIDLAEAGRQLDIAGRGAPSRVETAALPFYRGSVRQAARA